MSCWVAEVAVEQAQEERYTILVVREPAFASEIERLDARLDKCTERVRADTAVFNLAPRRRRRHRSVKARPVASNNALEPPAARSLNPGRA